MGDDAVPEFSGASPYEICQQYAAGALTRGEVRDELVRWPYGAQGSTAGDGVDDLIVDEPGSWTDVEIALGHGLIDASLYDEVLDAVSPEPSDD